MKNQPDVKILFQDKWLCVIEKSSGILSVPFSGWHGKTAQSVLEEIMRKNGTYSRAHKPFAVHRLDRDTSGVMMFAFSETLKEKIMHEWQTLVTERLYVAVAENPHELAKLLSDSGVIDSDISYNAYNRGFVQNAKNKFRAAEKTKQHKYFENVKSVAARTHYKILARGKSYTMFELSLETGRKNQIRVHLASRGYVIAGDKNYRAKTNPMQRLMLHARTLTFVHPVTAEQMHFEVAEPATWKDLCRG